MYSSEIQNYLASKNYKLTLKEYEDIIDSSPQITGIRLLNLYDFYFKVNVSTSDNHNWGIYILNYNQDDSMVQYIEY